MFNVWHKKSEQIGIQLVGRIYLVKNVDRVCTFLGIAKHVYTPFKCDILETRIDRRISRVVSTRERIIDTDLFFNKNPITLVNQ